MRLHMDYVKAFEVDRDSTDEDDWTEEDDAEIADIIKEIEEMEDPEVGSGEGEEDPDQSEEPHD
jgi:hypothetical protein